MTPPAQLQGLLAAISALQAIGIIAWTPEKHECTPVMPYLPQAANARSKAQKLKHTLGSPCL